MAATTKLLQLRPRTLPAAAATTTTTSIRLFSSSTPDDLNNPEPESNPGPPQSPQSQSPFTSYFSEVKASLKHQPPINPPQSPPPRRPFNYSSSNQSTPTSPSKTAGIEEIRRNLTEFRRRSASPPPPPPQASNSSQPISFTELYHRNAGSTGKQNSSPDRSKEVGKPPLEFIMKSLRNLRESEQKNPDDRAGKMNDSMPLSRLKKSLKVSPMDPTERDSHMVIGGSNNLPISVFGKEMKDKERKSDDNAMRTEPVKKYSHTELGDKLRSLRPEKTGDKEWFSIQELNERLAKLREIDLQADSGVGALLFRQLRDSLDQIKTSDEEKQKKSTMQRLDILCQLGRTPSYMLSPPKEHLAEKYFHPDNMSASEKLKIELQKVRDEFKMSETDCGSSRVQVAQLTTKIKHLSTALHKKDKHSRKGLQAMVQRRKKLLKYLRRTDWESYCFVLSKLGLRDNPDYKN